MSETTRGLVAKPKVLKGPGALPPIRLKHALTIAPTLHRPLHLGLLVDGGVSYPCLKYVVAYCMDHGDPWRTHIPTLMASV